MKLGVVLLACAFSVSAQSQSPTRRKPKATAAPTRNLSAGFITTASRAKDAIVKDTTTFNVEALTPATDRIREAEAAAASPQEKAFATALKNLRVLFIEQNMMVQIKRVTYN